MQRVVLKLKGMCVSWVEQSASQCRSGCNFFTRFCSVIIIIAVVAVVAPHFPLSVLTDLHHHHRKTCSLHNFGFCFIRMADSVQELEFFSLILHQKQPATTKAMAANLFGFSFIRRRTPERMAWQPRAGGVHYTLNDCIYPNKLTQCAEKTKCNESCIFLALLMPLRKGVVRTEDVVTNDMCTNSSS